MIPSTLGVTAMGRDLLAQDYMLKQLTASLIYPQKALGKAFWAKVYAKAQEKYGTTQIPVNTFNKVWIVPQRVGIYEHGQTAMIMDGHLKIMLEEDYLSMTKHNAIADTTNISENKKSQVNQLGSQIIRQIVLPEIEKEVNDGKNFSTLHQIFYAQALAVWFKNNLKQALLNHVYANKGTVKGIDQNNPKMNQVIYQQYLKAYKKGVFNFIKEDIDPVTQAALPRKYFSGGYNSGQFQQAMVAVNLSPRAALIEAQHDEEFLKATVMLRVPSPTKVSSAQPAMVTAENVTGEQLTGAVQSLLYGNSTVRRHRDRVTWVAELDNTEVLQLVGRKNIDDVTLDHIREYFPNLITSRFSNLQVNINGSTLLKNNFYCILYFTLSDIPIDSGLIPSQSPAQAAMVTSEELTKALKAVIHKNKPVENLRREVWQVTLDNEIVLGRLRKNKIHKVKVAEVIQLISDLLKEGFPPLDSKAIIRDNNDGSSSFSFNFSKNSYLSSPAMITKNTLTSLGVAAATFLATHSALGQANGGQWWRSLDVEWQKKFYTQTGSSSDNRREVSNIDKIVTYAENPKADPKGSSDLANGVKYFTIHRVPSFWTNGVGLTLQFILDSKPVLNPKIRTNINFVLTSLGITQVPKILSPSTNKISAPIHHDGIQGVFDMYIDAFENPNTDSQILLDGMSHFGYYEIIPGVNPGWNKPYIDQPSQKRLLKSMSRLFGHRDGRVKQEATRIFKHDLIKDLDIQEQFEQYIDAFENPNTDSQILLDGMSHFGNYEIVPGKNPGWFKPYLDKTSLQRLLKAMSNLLVHKDERVVKEANRIILHDSKLLSGAAIRSLHNESEVAKDKWIRGGIDLSQQDSAMRITKDANGGVKVDVDPAMIARVEREGISEIDPVIIAIRPADMRAIFGIGVSVAAP